MMTSQECKTKDVALTGVEPLVVLVLGSRYGAAWWAREQKGMADASVQGKKQDVPLTGLISLSCWFPL